MPNETLLCCVCNFCCHLEELSKSLLKLSYLGSNFVDTNGVYLDLLRLEYSS